MAGFRRTLRVGAAGLLFGLGIITAMNYEYLGSTALWVLIGVVVLIGVIAAWTRGAK